MTDSDDEDYGHLSLSERIQALKFEKIVKSNKISDNKSEESGFLNFSQKLRNTPCSQVRLKSDKTSDSEDEEFKFLKFSQKIRNTPYSQVKLKSSKAPDSTDEESEFLKFSERIRNTPCSQAKCKLRFSSGSESEEPEHSNFSERISNTVQSQPGLWNFHEADDSDSDDVFTNLSERILNTPQFQCGLKNHPEDSGSESDEIFSNFIAKIRTPKLKNRCYTDVSDSVSKEPKQHLSAVYQNKENLASKGTRSPYTVAQSANEREYASLFPDRSNDSLFCKKRAFYSQALFEFFNRKVFDYKLPKDLPLMWDESLVKTAGLTYSRAKNGIYTSSIKLSSKILTSFDRLQDTLLHEMCHAAVWMINKKDVGHGPLWKIWASRCKLILPFIECPVRCHNYEISYRFLYQCNNCQWKHGACRRLKRYHGAICKRCKTPITVTLN